MENNGAIRKTRRKLWIVLTIVLVLTLCVIGIVVAMSWRNWFGDKVATDGKDKTDIVAEKIENISSGVYTTNVDGEEIVYKAAYLVDGVELNITSGGYVSYNDDEVTFLVVNGGKVKFSGEDSLAVEKVSSDYVNGSDPKYAEYGLNSAIVVIGDGSKVEIEKALIETKTGGANAIMAINGGEIVTENVNISTNGYGSAGIVVNNNGKASIERTSIFTNGEQSPAFKVGKNGGSISANQIYLSLDAVGSQVAHVESGNVSIFNSNGLAKVSQIAMIRNDGSVNINDSEFSGGGIGLDAYDASAVAIIGEGSGVFSLSNSKIEMPEPEEEARDGDGTEEKIIYYPFFYVDENFATVNLNNSQATFGNNSDFAHVSRKGKINFAINNFSATSMKVETDDTSSVTGL